MNRVKGVVFDAFGTIVRTTNPKHPYRQILKIGVAQGRRPTPADTVMLMTNAFTLEQAADYLGITVSLSQLDQIQSELDLELASIEPFQDALACIAELRARGIKVAVCSNLALPYGKVVEKLFPDLDGYAFSYVVGALKPDPTIYESALAQLCLDADSVWMIGDSQRCDQDGPQRHGIRGHFLNRAGTGSLGDFFDLYAFREAVLNL
jgi:HAD superfamily hydrolase (TIGR01549 family)